MADSLTSYVDVSDYTPSSTAQSTPLPLALGKLVVARRDFRLMGENGKIGGLVEASSVISIPNRCLCSFYISRAPSSTESRVTIVSEMRVNKSKYLYFSCLTCLLNRVAYTKHRIFVSGVVRLCPFTLSADFQNHLNLDWDLIWQRLHSYC